MVAKTDFNRKDFELILKKYDIGNYNSSTYLNWAISNTIFHIKTNNGEYILKIIENDKISEIKFKLDILKYLEKSQIPVSQIIKNNLNERITIYKNKRIIILKFIKGEKEFKFNNKLVKQIGEYQALMNKYLMKIPLDGKRSWGDAYQFEKSWYNVDFYGDLNIKKEKGKLLREINLFSKEKLRRSLIHGDVQKNNLIVENSNLKAIIDLDDLHEDFMIYDLAIFIAHSLIGPTKINLTLIKNYINSFESKLSLNLGEKKILYYLIKFRLLNVISWNVTQLKDIKDKNIILKNIKKDINSFNLINNLNYDKFVENI